MDDDKEYDTLEGVHTKFWSKIIKEDVAGARVAFVLLDARYGEQFKERYRHICGSWSRKNSKCDQARRMED